MKLKSCPFCGDDAEFHLHHRTTDTKQDRGGIRCITVGCYGRLAPNYMSRKDAAIKWNIRSKNEKAPNK